MGTTKHFKSEVWKTFKLVKVVASGFIFQNLCCCHKCESVLSYSTKSGTSHLKRHVDGCITKKVTGAMNQYLNKTVTLTNAEKDSLKLLEMKHVFLGHHSFNSTEGPGLVELLQGMVNLGSKHGKFDIKPHLFGRNTVASCLKGEVTKVTSKIADIISETAASDCVSLTCDMWSDDYRKLSYIDVNAFWITKEFVMKNTLLGLKHFGSESHNAANITAAINPILQEYQLAREDIAVTTDRGSNIVCAFKEEARFDCMCHRLNYVLCDGWKEANLKSPELKEYSTSASELVPYCRTSVGLQEQLPITIKSGCATRGWTATEQRGTSIEKSKDELAIVLAGRNRLYLLSAVNLDLNRSVSILYKTFSLVFKKLEASDSPTINLEIPCYYKLHSLLKRIPGDEQPILVLKHCIMDGLNNKFYGSIKAIHWLGTFLDPSFRSFSFMPKSSTSDLEFKEKTINKWVLEQICQLKLNADEEPSVTRRRVEPTIPNQQQDFFSDMRENFAEDQSIPVVEIAYDERALRICDRSIQVSLNCSCRL